MEKNLRDKKSFSRSRCWFTPKGSQPSLSQVAVAALFFFLSTAQVSGSEGAHSNAYLKGHDLAVGMASFYSTEACKFNPTKGCPTACGDSLYKLEYDLELFGASWYYPLGSKVKVTNLSNKKSVVVTIKDRGPAKRLHRQIDLGKYAFSLLSSLSKGTIKVRIEKV